MKNTFFTVEGVPASHSTIHECAGFSNSWNGWAVPIVTKDQLQSFISAYNDGLKMNAAANRMSVGQYAKHIQAAGLWMDGDVFTFDDPSYPDDPDYTIQPNADGTYTLSMGWCFDRIEKRGADFYWFRNDEKISIGCDFPNADEFVDRCDEQWYALVYDYKSQLHDLQEKQNSDQYKGCSAWHDVCDFNMVPCDVLESLGIEYNPDDSASEHLMNMILSGFTNALSRMDVDDEIDLVS